MKLNLDFIDDWFFKFIWIFLPILYWPGIPERIEFFKVILFILITIAYFGYVGYGIHNNKKIDMRIVLLFLLLLSAQFISSVAGARPLASLFGIQYRYQGWVTQLSYVMIAILFSLSKSKDKYIGLASIVVALFTFGEFIYTGNFNGKGLLGNPNFSGGFLAMSLPFLNNIYLKTLILVAIVLTGSRSAIIAAGIICGLTILFKVKNIFCKLGIFAILILCFLAVYPNKETSHFDNRFNIWTKGIEAGFTKPFLGWGLENFELAFQSTLKSNDFDLKNIRVDKAHNELVEIFVNSGTIGLFLYLTIMILIVKKIYYKQKYLLCFIAFLVISNLNVVNINEYLFYYLIAGEAIS